MRSHFVVVVLFLFSAATATATATSPPPLFLPSEALPEYRAELLFLHLLLLCRFCWPPKRASPHRQTEKTENLFEHCLGTAHLCRPCVVREKILRVLRITCSPLYVHRFPSVDMEIFIVVAAAAATVVVVVVVAVFVVVVVAAVVMLLLLLLMSISLSFLSLGRYHGGRREVC